jgi:transcriptional regulator with XRE-family HTH domain
LSKAHEVGGLLRRAREEAGWPLRVVAKRLKVSIPYLSGVELGKRTITPARLTKLAKVLNLDEAVTSWLFVQLEMLPPDVEKRLAAAVHKAGRNPTSLFLQLDKMLRTHGDQAVAFLIDTFEAYKKKKAFEASQDR